MIFERKCQLSFFPHHFGTSSTKLSYHRIAVFLDSATAYCNSVLRLSPVLILVSCCLESSFHRPHGSRQQKKRRDPEETVERFCFCNGLRWSKTSSTSHPMTTPGPHAQGRTSSDTPTLVQLTFCRLT